MQFVWEAFFTFSQSGGAVEISGCFWYIATVFIPSTIITAVRVSHCHARQIYFNFIPCTGAKHFPAAVCMDFHCTNWWIALCFKAQWKYWWKKWYKRICISWEALFTILQILIILLMIAPNRYLVSYVNTNSKRVRNIIISLKWNSIFQDQFKKRK